MVKYTIRKTNLIKLKIILVILALAVFLAIDAAAISTRKEVFVVDMAQHTKVIVRPGESLWKIARTHGNPRHDIRKVIYEIQKIIQLQSATIHPGQIILVPHELSK
jgi:nucleoid-associated protein YgaU